IRDDACRYPTRSGQSARCTKAYARKNTSRTECLSTRAEVRAGRKGKTTALSRTQAQTGANLKALWSVPDFGSLPSDNRQCGGIFDSLQRKARLDVGNRRMGQQGLHHEAREVIHVFDVHAQQVV